MSARLLLAVSVSGLFALAGPVSGQTTSPAADQASVRPPSVALQPTLALPTAANDVGESGASFRVEEEEASPGGAFLRSLLLPGWGHVATGSPGRGAFYVAAQSGSLWMLWKSITRRGTARRAVELEREIVTARLQHQGITDPGTLFPQVDLDPAVQEWEELITTRDQQVEDWAAMSIFLVLLGAADAFVAAHLRDFPEPLSLRAGSNPATGGFEVGLSVPLGGGAAAR